MLLQNLNFIFILYFFTFISLNCNYHMEHSDGTLCCDVLL